MLATILVVNTSIKSQQIKFEPIWSNSKSINDNWLYLEKDSEDLPIEKDIEYSQISLPHTWNNLDVLETKDYRKATSWYRKNISFSKEQLKKRNYIRFNAAGQQAVVYLNGKQIAEHFGGYSAFSIELTKKLKKGNNVIDVKVSNKIDKTLAPVKGDFNFYGGLYRSVELLSSENVAISRTHFADSGYRVWSENTNSNSSNLKTTVEIDNGGTEKSNITLIATIFDYEGTKISSKKINTVVAANETKNVIIPTHKILKPELWSPENPILYKVEIQLIVNKKVVDKVSTNHGFKWFEFTADKGFFLNGKPYKLHGLNRHQDYYKKGNALPLSQHFKDIKLMKEIGVNWLRLAHYQQNEYVLQLCDKLGILVWEEIPYVGFTTDKPEYEKNLRSMMTDLINQHYNHSSIIVWGMGNEVWLTDRGDGKAKNYDLLKRQNDFIHSQDPIRKTVFVIGDQNHGSELKIVQIPDIFGYNLYRGWYGTHYNTLTDRLNELHNMDPNKPLILSEFGAGSDIRVHSENPQKQDFSIEFQNDFMESHLNQIEKLDWLSGVNWWSFADFGAAHRGDTKPHINQKGLLTFDREKKDVFYLLKSRWSKEPVLYLESPFWTERGGKPEKVYQVFSNMNEVELFQNGKSLGKQTKSFKWNVVLKDGANKLIAKGISGTINKEHGFTVNYKKTISNYKVSASKEEKETKAINAVDGNLETFWFATGTSEFNIDLKKISLVNGVKLNLYKAIGNKFNLEISGSVDNKNWIPLFVGISNRNAALEAFIFPKQQEIRYIKIVGKGIDKNNEFGIVEVNPIVTLEKETKNLYEKIGEGKAVKKVKH